ncbi:MAG: hypothetical protein RL090_277 [Bacteroidota bacterium]|jgi:uncharacterized membrane protein YgaE (UPF0421/DUF939 family)
MQATKLETLHSEHREWLNRIDFYYDDLKILRNRLEEVSARNTSKEVSAQIEHFENQFIIQRNELDEFRHAVNEAEEVVTKSVLENGTAVHRRSLQDDGGLRERMNQFETLFQQLRQELMTFLSKTL